MVPLLNPCDPGKEIPRGGEYFRALDAGEGLRKKTAAGAITTVGAGFSGHMAQVIGSVVLARLLKPEDFGLVIMVATISVLLMNFGVNGFTEAVIQQENLGHRQVSTLFWINLGCSAVLTAILIGLGPTIASFYGEPGLVKITTVMAFTVLFGGLSTQHVALLKRNMRFQVAAANELGSLVLSYIVAIVLALLGAGYWALVARQVSFTMAYCAGGWVFCSWRPGFPALSREVGNLVRFALSTYGTFVVSYFEKNLDKILIGKVQGTQSLGNYDRAYSLFGLPVSQITAPLSNVSLAALSRLRQDPDRYRRAYLKAVSLVAFIGMPLSAVLTVVGYDVILLLLGPKWEEAGLIFTIFAPSAGVLLVYSTHGWLHLSLGKADNWFRWSVVGFLVTALLFSLGLRYGAAGVALGRVFSIHLLAIPGLWYAGRPIGLKVSMVIRATWKSYASSLLAGICSWLFLKGFSIPGLSWGSLSMRILMGSSCCLILYVLFTVVLNQGMRPIMDFLGFLRESIGGLRAESRT